MNDPDVKLEQLVETENFEVFRTTGADGEVIYHVDLFSMTVHFSEEEWAELVVLITEADHES